MITLLNAFAKLKQSKGKEMRENLSQIRNISSVWRFRPALAYMLTKTEMYSGEL